MKGGTAVYALPPSTTPNYIFPYSSSADFSVSNISYLQNLLYRPLYWFGKGDTPDYNASLSVANAPTFSGNNVTITLKHYMWSNGQPVTASNVMFWINMETAEPANYGGYTGFPAAIVKNVKVVSPTELTMTMDKTYSHSWFLYNELAQIYPMPEAWDKTASGPSHCTTTVSDCKAVYTYLDGQSKTLNSYASSPIWSVVDGPWKLSAFNADGHITFVPNKSYSGPIKPTLSQFQEVPFTTDSAEYSVLQAPNSSIDVGYLPEQDAPAKPVSATVGTNPLHGYTLAPLYSWGINYYVVNYQSTTGQRADHQAAVLPAGAGLPDEPEVGDPGPAARLRPGHRRAGRRTRRRRSSCRRRRRRVTRSRSASPRPRACCPATAGRSPRTGRPPAPTRACVARGSRRARR